MSIVVSDSSSSLLSHTGVLRCNFFLFQAEDGIRDVAVTGVQRVLFRSHEVLEGGEKGGRALRRANGAVFLAGPTAAGGGPLERRAELEALAQEVREAEARRGGAARSEERRGGEGWRSRWSAYH